jgi:hypothetical protein
MCACPVLPGRSIGRITDRWEGEADGAGRVPDKKYREKGLAIVALDFEEPDQRGSLQRERVFVKKYDVEYTDLIAGAPSDMWEKVHSLSISILGRRPSSSGGMDW